HLANFRANHRKTLITDAGNSWTALVTSANPHDASSRHANQALRFSGPAALDLLQTEQAVGRLGRIDTRHWPQPPTAAPVDDDAELRVTSKDDIHDFLLEPVSCAADELLLAMEGFYRCHRTLVDALVAARKRGVMIHTLLDPNRNAFGREKNGLPNRQAGW